jgi:hypothetical protein
MHSGWNGALAPNPLEAFHETSDVAVPAWRSSAVHGRSRFRVHQSQRDERRAADHERTARRPQCRALSRHDLVHRRHPGDDSELRVEEGQQNIFLRNIRVDGGGSNCTSCGGAGLIWLGGKNVSGYYIDHIKAYHAYTWTHLVIEKGGLPSCTSATITNNEIGPGNQLYAGTTDGISLQCSNSEVAYNNIHDVTDGGIVIFGAPGSTVHDNQISNQDFNTISGIAMSDIGPWSTQVVTDNGVYCNGGDYTNTRMTGNTITSGRFFKVGIAMGCRLDGHCAGCNNTGGYVASNLVQSTGTGKVGYSYLADGIVNWTAVGNVSTAVIGGTVALNATACNSSQPAAYPFLMHRVHAISGVTLQPEFVDRGQIHGFEIRP